MTPALRRFLKDESSGGIVLAVAALLALVVSNSPWGAAYRQLLTLPGEVRIGGDWLVLAKPLVVWVNDLWMAVFFFLVGLEIKREFVGGELAQPSQVVLPAAAALGGMAVPALIYVLFNLGHPDALRGWAIPSATDIAFAIGIVTLLGSRVPASLKVFLTAVAIIDDLGAIVVIALFYTSQLSPTMLWGAASCLAVLFLLNRTGVRNVGLYVLVGLVMWVFVLKSGVHATLAGVATALAVPTRDPRQPGEAYSPLEAAEHALHPWVAFVVLPVFAFTNAGVDLQGVSPGIVLAPVTLGIAVGLLMGKTLGVFGTSWLLVRLGWAPRPGGSTWRQFFGVCVLCGIGFTMSLFIGELAFAGQAAELETELKLGVILGSVFSAICGAWILSRRA
ncbi:Na+/H+ antiporter NhaA [Aquabacterium sp.]|uniref:Na+/H+ antiporter NhaA n=1 Tax=Aquabacterium sp. TaxID=1872578 RepID=UPI0035AF1696